MPQNRVVSLTTALLMLLVQVACQPAAVQPTPVSPAPTQAPPTEAPPTVAAPPKDLVIVIPEDPPSFNAAIADSGYDALAMHLSLLGMAEVDPTGNVYPVLASELPTE